MSELPDVAPGEIIASAHINDIADRTIQRYDNFGDLGVKNPTPVTGELAFTSDNSSVWLFAGGSWTQIATNVEALTIGINITPGLSPRLNVNANSADVAGRFFRNTLSGGAIVIEAGSQVGEALFTVAADGHVTAQRLITTAP